METTKTAVGCNSSGIDPTNQHHLEHKHPIAAKHALAIRLEHLVETTTYMQVEERSNVFGPSSFFAWLDDGSTILSAHGKGVPFAKKREIRNESGLPIFELRTSSLTMQGAFYLELPGHSRDRLLELDLHGASDGRLSLHVQFVNKCARDGSLARYETQSKSTAGDTVVQVKGQDVERVSFDIVYLGAKVARIGRVVTKTVESARVNGKPGWEALVGGNVDLTIVSVCIIALAHMLPRGTSPAFGAGLGAVATA